MNYTKACLDMAPRVAEIMGFTSRDNPLTRGIFQPLPTLSDCLDWLEGKGAEVEIQLLFHADRKKPWRIYFLNPGVMYQEAHALTKLEAAYRAVIAVGEGGK